MSEKLCTLRTKGGGGGATYTETVLWTNSSPTSSFSPQAITLSDDINNYEYIGVKFNTDTTGITPSTAIMSVADYKKGVNTGTSGRRDVLSIASQIGTDGNYYSRRVSYVSDTSANISAAKLYGSSTTSNTDVIPLQILGIKMNGTITPSTLDLSMPPNASGEWTSVPAGGTKTIPVAQMPSFIFLIIIPNGGGVLTRLLNVETEICYQYSFYSSAWHLETVPDTDWTTRITSITDSSVTIKNRDTSNTQRMAVGIYY